MKNIFDLVSADSEEELFDTIVECGDFKESGFLLERIISYGVPAPTGVWLDQGWDEWVMLVRGEAVIEYEDGRKERMSDGDYVSIPAGCRHRVAQVSDDAVWIALHFVKQ